MNSNTIKMKQLASIFFLFAVAALPVTASSSSLATNIRGGSIRDNNRILEQSKWGNDGYNSNTGTSYHGGYYTQTSSTASSSSGGGTSSKPKKVSAPKPKPKPAPKPSAPSPSASSPSTPSSMSTHTNWDDDAWKDDNWGDDTWKDDTWEDDTWGDFAHEYGQEWHRSSSELAHNNGHGSRGAKLGMMFSLSAMIALAAVLIVKKVSCEKM